MEISIIKIFRCFPGFLLSFLILEGCGERGPTENLVYAPVVIEIDHQNVDSTYWEDTDSILVRITGSNFSPIVDTQSVDSLIFYFDVPTGDDRIFTAFAIDTGGVAYCWGRKDTTVVEADTTRLTIELKLLLSTAGDSILILRDSLPWRLSCTDSILYNTGITAIVMPSDSFATLTLDPIKNTIIIPSDQPQEFYDNFKTYITKFNNFVFNGGVMFFSACDKGWNNGDISASGFLFPSGVMLDTIYHTDTINVVTGRHPVLEGLDTLKGYFASYGWFRDYPQYTQIFTVSPVSDSPDTIRPTLMLYQYGSGLVLLSSQPLEYAYSFGTGINNVGLLLPRILGFLVDKRIRLYLR